MTTGPAILLAAAAAAAIGTIAAEEWGRLRLARIFRPTALASIILLAVVLPARMPERYRLLIIAGLGASFVGDAFMMAKKKRFIPGLIAFLAAQFFYTAAFLQTMTARLEFMTALPFFIYAIFVMRTLFPHLGSEKAPVTFYLVVMTIMTTLAAQRYIDAGGISALFALSGAVLFVVSDTILAVNKFIRKIPHAQFFILGIYFPAQIFFALSV